MSVQLLSKSIVSVSEMASMLSMSRSRLYQLIQQQVFPAPIYDVATRRPFFDEDLQAVCLEVRRRNCGINGKPILFYSTRYPLGQQTGPVKKAKPVPKKNGQYADLIDGLRSLGLEINAPQVEPVIKELFPNGIQNLDSGEVIRGVFLRMKRQNTTDKVGR